MPNRFVQGADGIWRSPPAETAARFYGFAFRIWTPSEVVPTWLQNIKFLQDYFNADVQRVPPEIRNQIVQAVASDLGLALADLRQRCQTATLDHIYNLLAHDELYVDLAAAPLTDSTRVKLFTCRNAADTHAFLNKNSTLSGSENGFVSSETASMKLDETAVKLLRAASPEDHSMANHRLQILFDREYRNSHPEPGRTIRRWRRSFRAAEELYGNGLFGLFPRFKDRGNHKPRFGEELLALVDRIIDDVYSTPTRPNKRHAYSQLCLECERKGFVTPGKSWFNERISNRSKYANTLLRQGKRAAHKHELFNPGAPNDNHGAFPWDVCLTDHTLCDVELVQATYRSKTDHL